MKKIGARLAFVIFAYKNFADDDEGNAWVETWFKEKDHWKHDRYLNIQLAVGTFSSTYHTKCAF